MRRKQLGISESCYRKSIWFRNMFLISAFAVVGMFDNAASAQCVLQTIWSPDGGGTEYYFSFSVAGSASLDVIVLGELGHDNYSGAAYIYRLTDNEWQLEEMFVAPDGPEPFNQFGRRVDMSTDGKTVLVSELRDANNGLFAAGAVWIYVEKRGKWAVQQKLTASDAEDGWFFGEKTALSSDGNVAAISATGAPGDPIYVFAREGEFWTEVGLLEGDGATLGLPWLDVSATGEVIVVGTQSDADFGQFAGAAYMFVRNGDDGPWLFRQKIYASDPVQGYKFGRAVALSATGDTLMVSASSDSEITVTSGAVYVFEREGDLWFEKVKLFASDPGAQDHFSIKTTITPDGQRAIFHASNNSGYVFDLIDDEWVETKRLIASDPNIFFGLGDAVAIADDGSTALLSAPNSVVDGEFWYGAAVLFDLEAPLGDFNCDGMITAADLLALLSNWGPCDDCEFHNDCPGDLDMDCAVGPSDLLILLGNWG